MNKFAGFFFGMSGKLVFSFVFFVPLLFIICLETGIVVGRLR